jgi:hypothetical protein
MRIRLSATALVLALPLAACGSSGTGDKQAAAITGNTAYAQGLKFSQCMRSHGVPSFPDPQPNGSMLLRAQPGTSLNPQAPAFQSAQSACKHLLPGGGRSGPVPLSVRRKALQFAACMRRHGIRNFPDPTFSTEGGVQISLNAGIDPRSPAFQSAQKACGGPGGALGGGPPPG